MFENFRMYMFAFHNAAHNKAGPFLRKYPDPGTPPVATFDRFVIQVGRYHHVDIKRVGGQIEMAVDGNPVLEFFDAQPFLKGQIIIRIRGTAHEIGSALIKNVRIERID